MTLHEARIKLVGAEGGNAPDCVCVSSAGSIASIRDGALKLSSAGSGRVSLVHQLPTHWAHALETGAGILREEAPQASDICPATDSFSGQGV